jgi:hypothetical protein
MQWLQDRKINNSVMQPVSRQQIGKHAPTTTEFLLETLFSTRSVQSGYKEENWGNQFN